MRFGIVNQTYTHTHTSVLGSFCQKKMVFFAVFNFPKIFFLLLLIDRSSNNNVYDDDGGRRPIMDDVIEKWKKSISELNEGQTGKYLNFDS